MSIKEKKHYEHMCLEWHEFKRKGPKTSLIHAKHVYLYLWIMCYIGFLTTQTTMVELSLSIKLCCENPNEYNFEDEWSSFWLDNDFEYGYMQDVNGQDWWTSNNLVSWI